MDVTDILDIHSSTTWSSGLTWRNFCLHPIERKMDLNESFNQAKLDGSGPADRHITSSPLCHESFVEAFG